MRKYLEKVAQTMASIEVDAELRLQNRAHESVDVQTFGYVQVTLQFMAQSEATSRPVSHKCYSYCVSGQHGQLKNAAIVSRSH